MSKKLIAPALLSAVLLTGCLGTSNPAATNTGATAGTNAGANTGTNTGANTGTNVGANVGAGASTGTAAAGYYAVGRKWVYDITNVTMGQTQKSTQTWECTAINGETATIKFTMTGGPTGDATSTSQVKLNQTPTASGALPEGTTITEKGTESITVGAGTYQEIMKRIQAFREEIFALAKQEEQPDRVMHFNIQYFPRHHQRR